MMWMSAYFRHLNLPCVDRSLVQVESLLDAADLSVELTRAQFEALNDDLFTRCINTVTTVLKDAQLTMGDVTDVVLVGGSTRVPALQDRLKALFGGRIELCRSINPDEVRGRSRRRWIIEGWERVEEQKLSCVFCCVFLVVV